MKMNTPFTWKTTLAFITVATLVTLLWSGLIGNGVLPVRRTLDYSKGELQFFQIWIAIALFVGVLLPGIAFLVFFRQPQLRKVLGFYLLVLIVQIAAEQILSSTLFPSIVVLIGTIYTAFRLWQLWQAQQIVAGTTQPEGFRLRFLNSLLWLMFLFWLSNLIMLVILPWGKIL
jgi:hypothetical protein